jgi:hypothetical protein
MFFKEIKCLLGFVYNESESAAKVLIRNTDTS